MLRRFRNAHHEMTHENFHVLIVGPCNVGKTNMFLRYILGIYKIIADATICPERGVRTIKMEDKTVELCVWDTPGNERFQCIVDFHYRRADGIIVVYDVTNLNSFHYLKKLLKRIDSIAPKLPRLLVGNKRDETFEIAVDYNTAKQFADELNIPFFEVSAKNDINIELVFTTIAVDIMRKKGLLPILDTIQNGGPKNKAVENLKPKDKLLENMEPKENSIENLKQKDESVENMEPERKLVENIEQEKELIKNLEPEEHLVENIEPERELVENFELKGELVENIEPEGKLFKNLEHKDVSIETLGNVEKDMNSIGLDMDIIESEQPKIISLKEDIDHIYNTKEFADVTFYVHGECFEAHKFILAARSSVFTNILMSPKNFEDIIVDEETVTKTGFEILLRFIYTDNLLRTDKQDIIEAYLAAFHYEQKSLLAKCELEIKSWIITTDDVLKLLDAGSKVHPLRNKCIDFIKSNAHQVLSSSSFSTASFKCLSIILESGAFRSVPAIDIIRQIMKWEIDHHSTPVLYCDVRERFLMCSPPLLALLGFESLSLVDLQTVDFDYPGLITPIELTKFMKYEKRKEASFLPKWCYESGPGQVL